MRSIKIKWYNKAMRFGGLRKTRSGFTLIEFSLSVAFVGILSIAIALIINDTIASYRRGMTLNQINTTGIDLVDDIRAAVQNSPVSSVKSLCRVAYKENDKSQRCEMDGAKNFVSVERLAKVKIRGKESSEPVPVYGALCTGSYSYIWNSGYFFSDEAEVLDGVKAAYLRYKSPDGVVTFPSDPDNAKFRLIKVKDTTRAICMSATFRDYVNERYDVATSNRNRNNYNNSEYAINKSVYDKNEFNITNDTGAYTFPVMEEGEIVESLVSDDGNNMVLYDLRASAPVENVNGNALYYSVSFVLGTVQGGINVMAPGNYCTPPADYDDKAYANFDYCAINKFNFAVQATGE